MFGVGTIVGYADVDVCEGIRYQEDKNDLWIGATKMGGRINGSNFNGEMGCSG